VDGAPRLREPGHDRPSGGRTPDLQGPRGLGGRGGAITETSYRVNNVCVYYCSTYYKAVREGAGTREEPVTLTQGQVAPCFFLVPLVWESNPKLQGGWCKTQPPAHLEDLIPTIRGSGAHPGRSKVIMCVNNSTGCVRSMPLPRRCHRRLTLGPRLTIWCSHSCSQGAGGRSKK